MNGGQPWSLRQCAGAVKFVLVRFRREMDLGTRLTTKARRSRRRTKKIRATDTETQSWQRVARRRIAAARACGRAETQTPSAIGLRFRPSVCPDSRPAAPACVRRVARLAACAPDLRVSVSPWQNPWAQSQRDIVADFARFSAGFAVSAFDVLLCVSVSPWQNPWTRPQRDIVARFGRFVFVPPRPAFVPRLAATKHYNRRPSVRVR